MRTWTDTSTHTPTKPISPLLTALFLLLTLASLVAAYLIGQADRCQRLESTPQACVSADPAAGRSWT